MSGTVAHVFQWLLILSVFAAASDVMGGLYGRSMCLRCGGRGDHRPDCPRR